MKGFLTISSERIKELKVEDKFKVVFKKILRFFAVAVIVLVFTIAISLTAIQSFSLGNGGSGSCH